MDPCLTCHVSTRTRRRYIISQEVLEANQFLIDFVEEHVGGNHVFGNEDSYICRPCWQRAERAYRNRQRQQVPDEEIQPAPAIPIGGVPIPGFKRFANTTSHCLFPGCESAERLRIPERIKIKVMCDIKVFIPENARICQTHLRSNQWETLIDSPRLIDSFDIDQISEVFKMVQTASENTYFLDFENVDDIDPDELYFWTAVTAEQFKQILEETPKLREDCKNPNLALGIFLSKIRTGDSDERLANLHQISRRKMERLLHKAADGLTEDFIPRHLGIDHITRNEIINRNLRIPDGIFGNPEATIDERKLIFIFDGTYIYVQKSSNFSFQRRTYSLHKYDNLLKPFVITCGDGYIIDVIGPYSATTTDANIMSQLMADESDFHWFFRSGDIFVLDRGFRDSLPIVESCGYEAHMPPTKSANETQLSTTQANKSRLVTICRWVVEAINGRFKRDYKLFRQDYFNRALPHMFQFFKIAAALLNTFRASFTDSQYAEQILDEINSRINEPNLLADYVSDNNLNRQRASFISITADEISLNDFPRWDESETILFALGTYQIRLARSYCSEHVRDGVYTIEVVRDAATVDFRRLNVPNHCYLLRGRIQSRHTRARIYYVYIIVDREGIGRRSVPHYYCTCLTGRRTLGCCAHVMSIVWYLGWARHQGPLQLTAPFLDELIIN